MKIKFGPQANLIKAIIVSIVMSILAFIGLNIPEQVVKEAVDTQFQTVDTTRVDQPASAISAEVSQVVDGDTINVVINGKADTVRVIGINTPEVAGSPKGSQCYGDKASLRAKEILEGQTVTLTTDSTQATRDTYNRLLAYVTLADGRDFGEVMITEGLAREYTYAAAYVKQTIYQAAEAEAKKAGTGLWSGCGS